MTRDEARRHLEENGMPSRDLVVQAKAYAVTHFSFETRQIVEGFERHMEAARPDAILGEPPEEAEFSLKRMCHHAACRMAIGEAIWSLIHSDLFLSADDGLPEKYELTVSYRTPRGGGGLGDLPQFKFVLPRSLQMGSDLRAGRVQPLSNGDLYVREFNVLNLHPLVEESLREAVECFRRDLYTPCLAMLTRAVEGAWTELGLALVDATPPNHAARAQSLRKDLESAQFSLNRRMLKVRDYYADANLCGHVVQVSPVRVDDLKQAWVWSDQVRDSRNVLHYQAQPAMTNTYEKVAALMIGAVPHLRTIYQARDAAKSVAANSGTMGATPRP